MTTSITPDQFRFNPQTGELYEFKGGSYLFVGSYDGFSEKQAIACYVNDEKPAENEGEENLADNFSFNPQTGQLYKLHGESYVLCGSGYDESTGAEALEDYLRR